MFDLNGGHLDDFRVRGWYNSTFNRPYLALDETRDTLFITDPDSKRVLVYDTAGECIGSFGEAGEFGGSRAISGNRRYRRRCGTVTFMSVIPGAGRVLKFAPFLRE